MPHIDPHTALATDLGDEVADALMPYLTRRDLKAGEVLLRHGELAASLFLVCTGELFAAAGDAAGAIPLGPVTAGQWLGEVNVIDGGPATATVIARTPCVLLGIDRARLSRLQAEDPNSYSTLLTRLCRDLAARLRRSTSVLDQTLVPEEPAARRTLIGRVLAMLAGAGE